MNSATRDAFESTPQFNVLGVSLDDLSADDVAERVAQAVIARRRVLVVNANAHMLTLAQRRRWLRTFITRADIAFCDGAGVQLAARLLNGRAPHRTTPPEWIEAAARRIGPTGTVFWLGGQPEVVERAATVFAQRTGTSCVGWHHGFFDISTGSADNAAVVAEINRASPDLLIVNMGMPRQEQWLRDHWDLLDARAGIAAGALVDHIAGRVRRPPRWVANIGLEWAVRLAVEPRRLWRRYLLGLPVFGSYVLRELFFGRPAVANYGPSARLPKQGN